MVFYGVTLPPPQPAVTASGNGDGGSGSSSSSPDPSLPDPASLVLDSKEEVLKLLKVHKGGRFKAFPSREEAEAFVREAAEARNSNSGKEEGDKKEDVVVAATPATGEGCAFSSLTPQQLKALKEAIKRGDVFEIDKLVDSNPRYLVTPCDTPSILHSGTRSNALHVAAESGSVKIAEKVLSKVQDPNLMSRMYPTETAEARSKRQEYLLDLFLNMPNKGHNDTPLHQASKAGYIDVVKLLVSFSSCDTLQRNRDGKTPADMACSRMAAVDVEVKRQILKMLTGQVYIPVIRDTDLVVPGFIGEPWSPHAKMGVNGDSARNNNLVLASPRPKMNSNNNVFLQTSSPSPMDCRSPLLLHGGSVVEDASPLRSPMMVRALLGPLTPEEARQIKEEWNASLDKATKLADPMKGIEKRGREMAKKHASNLFEYWEFLDAYSDLSTPDGLILLETHLYNLEVKFQEEERRKRQKEMMEDVDREIFAGDRNINIADKDNPLSPVSQLTRDLDAFHVTSPPTSDRNGNAVDLHEASNNEEESPVNDSFTSFSSSSSSSSNASSYETADEGVTVYIGGLQPSKADGQVYEILKNVDISVAEYPSVHAWKSTVSATPAPTRESWGNVNGRRRKLLNVPKLIFEIN